MDTPKKIQKTLACNFYYLHSNIYLVFDKQIGDVEAYLQIPTLVYGTPSSNKWTENLKLHIQIDSHSKAHTTVVLDYKSHGSQRRDGDPIHHLPFHACKNWESNHQKI